ncbi:RagB/SusD family nutrient uptake outer membrane protein [Paraflavitalea sp. CAU 1676]|uniref:RagB/SusD family nutrient uptake outer membrane protein n=1 Tax=Paraflavitalea sp. CAU 1676 TaxID=3032598 RepID=UPI0023DB716D|nr:RagB/SusD family nutrient uptake outer membrane protein [Paraflavitalea sp. CAU 1676]MDF2192936.1 RagB/SusD family nutrient uptake outer membrane protein [Paraflavitalea sp. CAU 1676]
MKTSFHIICILLLTGLLPACNKIIDLKPESNVSVENFYRTYDEVKTALTGCYNGMQKPLETEWMMTELRSDIAKQGATGSTAVANIELNDLNTYLQNSGHSKVYDYWYYTYKNIRSANYVLRSLGVTYNNGQITLGESSAQMEEERRKQLAGEALFIRAYHYFNLVRLFGGVFLLTESKTPAALKLINRSTPDDCYKLITADLETAKNFLPRKTYSQQAQEDLGRATVWAAEALLAKVYLTTNRKAEALTLLDDVINFSGHDLLSSYADVFSINNEMSKEIIFAVRYKAGGLGLGNYMANSFAALNSGSAIVNGNGSGLNYPTANMESKYVVPATGAADKRRDVTIGKYSGNPYLKKYTSPVMIKNDAENDFPVLRFADILLLKAEAMGYSQPAVDIINRIRGRAGAVVYPGTGSFTAAFYLYPDSGPEANTDGNFLGRLLDERRIELAFENHRLFDIYRTGQFENVMNAYYTFEYDTHYKKFKPAIPLDELKNNLKIRTLLPIPQRELDSNNQLAIPQNQGY